VQPVQQEQFMESMGNPFETKDLVQFAMQEKLACGNAHADNVALPFGWIYVSEKLQPIDKK
jgi:hypothetical protein